MAEPKKPTTNEHQPHGRRDRDSANDHPQKRRDYAAGANGEQDVDASGAEAEDTMKPDRDGTGW
jgi:hypothetical protein